MRFDKRTKKSHLEQCPRGCPPPLSTEISGGRRICSSCGAVIERNIIDESAEARQFASDGGDLAKDRQRSELTSNPFYTGSYVSGRMEYMTAESRGGGARTIIRSDAGKKSKHDLMIDRARDSIRLQCQRLRIHSKHVEITALSYFNTYLLALDESKTEEGKKTKRYPIDSKVPFYTAACLFRACILEREEIPKSFIISSLRDIQEKDLNKADNDLRKMCSIIPRGRIPPHRLVDRIVFQMKIDQQVSRVGVALCEQRGIQKVLSGKIGTAAAAIVLFLLDRIRKSVKGQDARRETICRLMGVTKPTVNNALKEMTPALTIGLDILPEDVGVFSISPSLKQIFCLCFSDRSP
ncbi:Transcription factor TFIIB like protein [Aduncisulcus paluster]|uniref:Transcription factor TFIIB like protein n=1 Tax=Aduncisulcus paluster TaxID=2918883 RepID=A0ABQ5KWC9_9EUKA|nr:Transcription factor TFIIB like protein [Aduncisulcus paluster]